jgi:hypothetical protein
LQPLLLAMLHAMSEEREPSTSPGRENGAGVWQGQPSEQPGGDGDGAGLGAGAGAGEGCGCGCGEAAG